MPHSIKSKTALVYSFQVWLTSAVVGPILCYLPEGLSGHAMLTFMEFYWVALIVGLIFSFFSFLLLWAGVTFIDGRSLALPSKKLLVASWAMVLASAPFMFIINLREPILERSNLIFIGGYMVPLLVAVFFFRWPKRVSS